MKHHNNKLSRLHDAMSHVARSVLPRYSSLGRHPMLSLVLWHMVALSQTSKLWSAAVVRRLYERAGKLLLQMGFVSNTPPTLDAHTHVIAALRGANTHHIIGGAGAATRGWLW